MLDNSSISFTSYQSSVLQTPSNSIENILTQFEGALNSIDSTSFTQTKLLQKLGTLLQRTREAFSEIREEQRQQKKKCLEHIQILLYQKDYAEALRKIDFYKNTHTKQISIGDNIDVSEFCLTPPLNAYREHCQSLNFDEALRIIENRYTPFEQKHKIWLNYIMPDNNCEESQLQHITYQEIQNAQIKHFKQQFSMKDSSEEDSHNYQQYILNQNEVPSHHDIRTPQKDKKSKSMIYLKSNCKKSGGKEKSGKKKSKSPSIGKYKSGEKKTAKKVGGKQGSQNKTSKKNYHAFVF